MVVVSDLSLQCTGRLVFSWIFFDWEHILYIIFGLIDTVLARCLQENTRSFVSKNPITQDEIIWFRNWKRNGNILNRGGNTTYSICFRPRIRDCFSWFRLNGSDGTGPLFVKFKYGLLSFPMIATYFLTLLTGEIDFTMNRVETNIAQNLLNFHRRSETTRYGTTLGR